MVVRDKMDKIHVLKVEEHLIVSNIVPNLATTDMENVGVDNVVLINKKIKI